MDELLPKFFLMVDFSVQFDTMGNYYNASNLLFFDEPPPSQPQSSEQPVSAAATPVAHRFTPM